MINEASYDDPAMFDFNNPVYVVVYRGGVGLLRDSFSPAPPPSIISCRADVDTVNGSTIGTAHFVTNTGFTSPPVLTQSTVNYRIAFLVDKRQFNWNGDPALLTPSLSLFSGRTHATELCHVGNSAFTDNGTQWSIRYSYVFNSGAFAGTTYGDPANCYATTVDQIYLTLSSSYTGQPVI
jgi:hypothetical protein